MGTIETSSPYKNEPKVHTFDSAEEALSFADAVHQGTASQKWWKKIDIGYYDSKLAAQELISREVKENGLNIVSVLPDTFFGPYDFFIGNGMYLIRIYNNSMPGVLKEPCLLSRAMVKAASYPSFYSNEKAEQELGYTPQFSFKKAVADMYDYYKKIAYFSKKTRLIDK
ncbi:MAG: hypothetical protein ACOC44_16795 [Promethearchaeia archaeon]